MLVDNNEDVFEHIVSEYHQYVSIGDSVDATDKQPLHPFSMIGFFDRDEREHYNKKSIRRSQLKRQIN